MLNDSRLGLIQEMKRKKKSNDLYILGSGASINDIKKWDLIRGADSIGFNFWLLHDFVPNYYMVEAPRDKVNLDVMLNLFSEKKESYKDAYIIIKDRSGSGEVVAKFKQLGIGFSKKKFYNFGSKTEKELLVKVEKYKLSKFKKNLVYSQGVASVELIVVIGWLMGYKTITLCGIDLNNTDYFYNSSEWVNKSIFVPDSLQRGTVHKTNDPTKCYGGIPVDEVLKIYQERLLVDECQIYVESNCSALADYFPVRSLS